MICDNRQYLWVERYRPQTIDDCILPDSMKNTFNAYVDQGRVPNLLLAGSPGCGKTTVAKALCNEIGADWLFINGSEDSGIEVLRTTIRNFASTTSLSDSKKVVILDESDYLQANSTQPALRNFIEEFSNNCSFILTCNNKNRIIEPLHSRCAVIDFKYESSDEIRLNTFKRVCNILKNEQVQFDPKIIVEFVKRYFPDFRRMLNELQRQAATSGKIDTSILVTITDDIYKPLFDGLKKKNFTEVRKWVATSIHQIGSSELLRVLYDKSNSLLETASLPQLVVILGEYQYRAAFPVDPEINLMACLTEVMSQCSFKNS